MAPRGVRTCGHLQPCGAGPRLREHKPDAVMHLAAESHVDRSIEGPGVFIETNVVGTYRLLEAAREYWSRPAGLAPGARFRFHHVSTDEVYGSLGRPACSRKTTPYAPHSPYSASKASADHLVRAWRHTYGLPVVCQQLLQQLRAVPFSREADPADDHQRAGRQAAAGLRRRRQCARLAVRRGPRRALCAHRHRGQGRRELQCRRQRGAQQPRGRPRHLRHAGRACCRSGGRAAT